MHRTVSLCRVALVACVAQAAATQLAVAETFSRHFDGVLGTSMDLAVHGVDETTADTAFTRVQNEVQRLEAVFSAYREGSELSRLNRNRSLPSLSPELAELIEACREWERKSRRSFSCKLGAIRSAWRAAVEVQEPPDRRRFRAMARNLRRVELPDPQSLPYILPEGVELDLGGIAKGYIIDRAYDVIRDSASDATGIKVDIGGDARYGGTANGAETWRVGLAGPAAYDNAPSGVLRLNDQAIAASGHQTRTYDIGRRTYSHILSARDGWPVHNPAASYVVAESALVADVVATALASNSAADAAALAEAQSDIESLLVLSSGRQIASTGWRSMESITADRPATPIMSLTYTIPRVESGKYRRPYVALWLSDAQRRPIRNLLLLGESERWAQENTRWWRAVGRDNGSLLHGYARATRRPGTYTVLWDGRDDHGRPVEGQRFRLHLEAAREHGDHTYTSIEIDLTKQKAAELSANGELGNVAIQWLSPNDASMQDGVLSAE
ncbi:MAG: DUF2271 domain-containing protein [Pseudomonadota bacterium]